MTSFIGVCVGNDVTGDDSPEYDAPLLDLPRFEVLSFDCYGTLIDWETGLWRSLEPILERHDSDIEREAALELYGTLEAEAERGVYRPYRSVLRAVLESIGARLGFRPSEEETARFADSVAAWPAFPDTVAALRALGGRHKLAILSNIDDDLFASSALHLKVPFDLVVTAQQVGSYKPSRRNFRVLLERLAVPPDRLLHVAQSLYHDIAPARALGLATVWVNRRHAQPGPGATPPASARPDLEVPDLATLAALATR